MNRVPVLIGAMSGDYVFVKVAKGAHRHHLCADAVGVTLIFRSEDRQTTSPTAI